MYAIVTSCHARVLETCGCVSLHYHANDEIQMIVMLTFIQQHAAASIVKCVLGSMQTLTPKFVIQSAAC